MNLEHKKIDDRFKILKKIGEGSFGLVYKAKDLLTNHKVALKIETNSQGRSQLQNEIQAYTHLSGIDGIPTIISSGRINESHYCVTDLFKSSLTRKLRDRNKSLSLGCALNISLQLLDRLESIHNSCYIHRDIKPSNLMFGRHTKSKKLYLIDFGLCKKYKDPVTKQHSLYGEDRQMIGNVKYASLNTHLGIEQSRRDDLESWFYLTIFIIQGKLPWDEELSLGNPFSVLKIKSHLTPEELCKECPEELLYIFKSVKSLHFEECPKYNLLRNSIRQAIERLKISIDLDWAGKKTRRKTGNSLTVKKPNDIRRKSVNNVGQLAVLTHDLNLPSSNSHSNNSQESYNDSKLKHHEEKKSGSKISSKDTNQRSNASSMNSANEEEVKLDDPCKQLERIETIKNIYPAFTKKHVHFIEPDESPDL